MFVNQQRNVALSSQANRKPFGVVLSIKQALILQ